MDARHVLLTSALLGGGGIEAPEEQVDHQSGFIVRAWASTAHNQAPTSTQVDWYLCTCKPGHSSTLKLLKIEVTVTSSSGRRLDNADVSSGARRLTASSVQVAHTLSLHKSNFRCPPRDDFSMEPSFINGMTTGTIATSNSGDGYGVKSLSFSLAHVSPPSPPPSPPPPSPPPRPPAEAELQAVSGIDFDGSSDDTQLREGLRSIMDAYESDSDTKVDATAFLNLFLSKRYANQVPSRKQRMQAMMYLSNALSGVRKKSRCGNRQSCDPGRKKMSLSPAALGVQSAFRDSRLSSKVSSCPPRTPRIPLRRSPLSAPRCQQHPARGGQG